MKTVWFGVTLSLLAIVAYSVFPDALSGAGRAPVEIPASPSIAATPPSPNRPAATIALDASSDRPTPGSTGNDNSLPAGLSEYVFLHKALNESLSAPTPAGLSVPWRWLRAYAVTQMPIENR